MTDATKQHIKNTPYALPDRLPAGERTTARHLPKRDDLTPAQQHIRRIAYAVPGRSAPKDKE